MLEPVEKEIDGTWFRYQPFMLKQSRRVFDKLAQRFGPSIAAAVEGLGSAKIDAEMELSEALGGVTDAAGGFLRNFVNGLDPDYHAELANELAKQTQYKEGAGEQWRDQSQPDYALLNSDVREMMFGANLLTEAKLIWWCLSVQYADFLAPLRDLGMQAISLRGMATSALGSRRASTGSSTESPRVTNIQTA